MAREEPGGQVQLPYKPEDYAYSVMWSEDDDAYVGRVAEFTSLAAHGASPAAALREITDVVGCVLEDVVESGEPVPPPGSKRPLRGKPHSRACR